MKNTRYKWLFSKYKDPVYTYAYYFLGNRFDAQDVSQKVLIRLWQHLDSIKLGKEKAWLFKTARNLCIDFSRRYQARNVFYEADEEFWNTIQDPKTTDQHLNQELLRSELNQLLAQLPETWRTIIIMREIQGMNYRDISQSLDLSLNAVKVTLHRARKGLKDLAHKTEYHHDQL